LTETSEGKATGPNFKKAGLGIVDLRKKMEKCPTQTDT
jgi:hypothetical protein